VAEPSAGRPSASLHFAVGEMSGKLDNLTALLVPQLADHETRIGALEVWQGRLLGGGAVIVLIITALEAIPYAWHHLAR
jgi:hypothetical protein